MNRSQSPDASTDSSDDGDSRNRTNVRKESNQSRSNNQKHQNHHSNSSSQKSSQKETPKNINELLKNALEEASMRHGEEDDEPILLEAPGGGGIDIHGKTINPRDSDDDENDNSSNSNELDEADRNDRVLAKIRKQKQKAIEEEERKVAEMKFNHEALLPVKADMHQRAKFIPLRLTYEERKELRLVNSTIAVSNYTNIVDLPFKNKMKRRHAQLQAIVSFLTGLMTAQDYAQGQALISDRNFNPHEGDYVNLYSTFIFIHH